MAVVQTYATLTAEQRTFYELALLEYAKKNLPHWMVGQKGKSINLPTRTGDTIQWRKFSAFSAATTPLSESETPVGSDLTITSTTGTVYEYGDFVRYSDFLKKTAIDDIPTEISKILGYQCGQLIH